MASGARDLTFRFLSQTDQFDLAKPAEQLDDVATSADDAARKVDELGQSSRELDKLGASADDAGRKLDDLGRTDTRKLDDLADKPTRQLDELGDEAKSAAKRVDSAMDAIAKSSKRAERAVDDVGDGFGDLKDEAGQSGREAAASFSGEFGDVGDFIQETIANGFSGMGKVGAAAGIAAAVGIGILTNGIAAAREKVAQLSSSLADLKLDNLDTTAQRVRTILDQLRDDGDLDRFASAARTAGIDFGEYVLALAEGGPRAQEMKDRLEELSGAVGGLATIAGEGAAAHDLINRLGDQAVATEAATATADALAQAQKRLTAEQGISAESLDAYNDAIDGFVDSAGVYSQLLADKQTAEQESAQATADATKSQTDSWEDYAKDVSVSVDDYLDELDRQVSAQEDWAENLKKLAKRGVDDGVLQELARMGPEGAPLVAKLTSASGAELDRLVALYGRKGRASADEIAQGIREGAGKAGHAVDAVRIEMQRRANLGVGIPISYESPSAGEAYAVRERARRLLAQPINIPVRYQDVGNYRGPARSYP